MHFVIVHIWSGNKVIKKMVTGVLFEGHVCVKTVESSLQEDRSVGKCLEMLHVRFKLSLVT